MKTRASPFDAGSPVPSRSGRAVQPAQGTIGVACTVRSHERPSAENHVVNGGATSAASSGGPPPRYPPASLRTPSMLPPDPVEISPSLVHASGGAPDGGTRLGSVVAPGVCAGVATGGVEGADDGGADRVGDGDEGTTIEGPTAATDGAGDADDGGSEVHAATSTAVRTSASTRISVSWLTGSAETRVARECDRDRRPHPPVQS